MPHKNWDVFISHASEDKADVARPLAALLRRAGVRVWLDEHELSVGDSLSEKIDHGLSSSTFGIVVLSPSFFNKHWPRKELAGLRAREENGQKLILPIWHNVSREEVASVSPIMADAIAVSTSVGLEEVCRRLLRVLFAANRKDSSDSLRFAQLLDEATEKQAVAQFLRGVSDSLGHIGEHLDVFGPPAPAVDVEVNGQRFEFVSGWKAHGLGYLLSYFSDVLGNPFRSEAEDPQILPAVMVDLERTRRTSEWMLANRGIANKLLMSQMPVGSEVAFMIDRADEFTAYALSMCYFRFQVFAGRRRYVDADAKSASAWGRVLREYDSIVHPSGEVVSIRLNTYDEILDGLGRLGDKRRLSTSS